MKFRLIVIINVLLISTTGVYAELHDRGGGLIYDDVLDVTLLQDTNFAMTSCYDSDGLMNRNDALAWADQLEYGGYNNWRLLSLRDKDGNYPDDFGYDINSTEFGYLYYVELGNPSGGPLVNVYPFTNIPPPSPPWSDTIPYWSNTEIPTNSDGGRYFLFNSGQVGGGANWNEYYAWAVRDGDVIPTIDAILEYFYAGVEDETIYGRGRKPWIANHRLRKFGHMLVSAQRHFDHDRVKKACRKLNSLYRRCDGAPRPPDYIKGDAVSDLSDMILDLIESECQ